MTLAGLATAEEASGSPGSDLPGDTDIEAAGSFEDVSGTHRASVEVLAEKGIFDGTECATGRFCPNLPIQRWVMAVWLVRALDGADPAPADPARFADVDERAWWAVHVERLAELGITQGCATEPARFCPESPVPRAQMATFLTRAFRLPSGPAAGFADVADGSTHQPGIAAVAAAGITTGCKVEPARYCPQRATTRAHMATFLTRALEFDRTNPPGPSGIPAPGPGTSSLARIPLNLWYLGSPGGATR